MKYLALLVICFFICASGHAQYPVQSRTNGANTILDPRFWAGKNLLWPRYLDTTEASLPVNIGNDSCAAVIYTVSDGKTWKRACNPRRWIEIQNGPYFFEADFTAPQYFLNQVTPDITPAIIKGKALSLSANMVGEIFPNRFEYTKDKSVLAANYDLYLSFKVTGTSPINIGLGYKVTQQDNGFSAVMSVGGNVGSAITMKHRTIDNNGNVNRNLSKSSFAINNGDSITLHALFCEDSVAYYYTNHTTGRKDTISTGLLSYAIYDPPSQMGRPTIYFLSGNVSITQFGVKYNNISEAQNYWLGNSIIQGITVSPHSSSYVRMTADTFNIPTINYGKSALSVKDLMKVGSNLDVIKGKTVFLLNPMVADFLFAPFDSTICFRTMDTLVKRLQENNNTIILMTNYTLAGFSTPLNNWVLQSNAYIRRKYGGVFKIIDLYGVVSGGTDIPDGIHVGAIGSKKIYDVIVPQCPEIFKRTNSLGSGGAANFANTDLRLTDDRTHNFDNHSMTLDDVGLFKINGPINVSGLPNGGTTSDSLVVVAGDGTFKKKNINSISPTSISISSLTAANSNNGIDNGDNAQTWNWNSLSGPLGAGLALSSSSTMAASNVQILFKTTTTGINANANQKTISTQVLNSHSGTGAKNIAGYFSATQGANNYAIIVPPSSGNVGIGTNDPISLLHVVGSIRGTDSLIATGIASNVGTKALRYNPSTGNITYADTTTSNAGTVTTFSATDGNGFDFSVSNATTTPTLTATTTVGNTQLFYSNSGAMTGDALITRTGSGAINIGTSIQDSLLFGSTSASGTLHLVSTTNVTPGIINFGQNYRMNYNESTMTLSIMDGGGQLRARLGKTTAGQGISSRDGQFTIGVIDASQNSGMRFFPDASGFTYIDGYSDGSSKATNYPMVFGARVNNTGVSVTGVTTAETGTNFQFGYQTTDTLGVLTRFNSKTRGIMLPSLDSAARSNITTKPIGLKGFDPNYKADATWDGSKWTYAARTLSGQDSLDFPSISASSIQELTISVPGAILSDAVIIGIPESAMSVDVEYSARVSSPNTVTIRGRNFNAISNVNPAKALFTAVVLNNRRNP